MKNNNKSVVVIYILNIHLIESFQSLKGGVKCFIKLNKYLIYLQIFFKEINLTITINFPLFLWRLV